MSQKLSLFPQNEQNNLDANKSPCGKVCLSKSCKLHHFKTLFSSRYTTVFFDIICEVGVAANTEVSTVV